MEKESVPQGVDHHHLPSFSFTLDEKGTNFYVTLVFTSPTTRRKLKKKFAILIPANTKNKDFWTKNVIAGAVLRYFEEVPRIKVLNMKSKRELGNGVYRILKNVTVRSKGKEILSRFEEEGKKYLSNPDQPPPSIAFASKYGAGAGASEGASEAGPDMGGTKNNQQLNDKGETPLTIATRAALTSIAKPQPSTSVFEPTDTGVTYAMIGKSKSGKTTFLVKNLNLLTEKQLSAYNAIIYFTKSPNANPLADVEPRVRSRLLLVGRFCPRLLQTLKRINDETECRFKFLVIFDDILQLRGQLLTECILTLRNSNISTALSIQYEKLMSPAQRASVHNVYIFNLRTEQWEFFLKGFIVGNVKEMLPPLRPVKRVWELAQTMREIMNPFILHYNQVDDETEFYRKK